MGNPAPSCSSFNHHHQCLLLKHQRSIGPLLPYDPDKVPSPLSSNPASKTCSSRLCLKPGEAPHLAREYGWPMMPLLFTTSSLLPWDIPHISPATPASMKISLRSNLSLRPQGPVQAFVGAVAHGPDTSCSGSVFLSGLEVPSRARTSCPSLHAPRLAL